jgi:hypothetical protein
MCNRAVGPYSESMVQTRLSGCADALFGHASRLSGWPVVSISQMINYTSFNDKGNPLDLKTSVQPWLI